MAPVGKFGRADQSRDGCNCRIDAVGRWRLVSGVPFARHIGETRQRFEGHVARSSPQRTWRVAAGAVAVGVFVATLPADVRAQTAASIENRPYDDKLMRLAEILGSVHFLRELCAGTDGQVWRDRMRELLEAEGSTALRKARLTRSFNNGYRSYSRTYIACTPTAQTAVSRFIAEATEIAETLVKTVP